MVNFENGVTPINDTNLNKAQTELQEQINNFTKTTDANGWTVLDFGYYKEYLKNTTQEITMAGNSWTQIPVSDLPIGMSTFGTNNLTASGRALDPAVSCNFACTLTSNKIYMSAQNQYTQSVTTNIVANFRILELLNN